MNPVGEKEKRRTTPNNGSLGSQVDEERSKLREIRRIAGPQKPKCVERIWRFQQLMLEARLPEGLFDVCSSSLGHEKTKRIGVHRLSSPSFREGTRVGAPLCRHPIDGWSRVCCPGSTGCTTREQGPIQESSRGLRVLALSLGIQEYSF